MHLKVKYLGKKKDYIVKGSDSISRQLTELTYPYLGRQHKVEIMLCLPGSKCGQIVTEEDCTWLSDATSMVVSKKFNFLTQHGIKGNGTTE